MVIDNWKVLINHIAHQAMYDVDGAQSADLIQIAEMTRRVIQLSVLDHSKMGSSDFENNLDSVFSLVHGLINKHFSSRPIEQRASRLAANQLRRVLQERAKGNGR